MKDARTNSRKIDPPLLFAKYPQWLDPPCPYGHTKSLEKSYVFCTKECGRPHLKNPLPVLRKISEYPHWTTLPPPRVWTYIMERRNAIFTKNPSSSKK